ncbi:Protoporphyrinogen IX oxidase, menaquinone-dependent (flavodoxin domain) [Clostridium amylolyticum]|uniref:Protoporphyrinogen IX oxidase, menaquinone-dependent (Flavodoxin domain) n=1 Tax=Clostridium amylolyticum TaxID=1121298 RepID=A0A1M6MEP9_9CLOT|nr:flavodoxin domain-containing protein [Clostridium amylolyticum]SHJ81941.1 Protoporphyrinogen IX oxidase, menaquinone-dependent (flavodoxin domain) [Clostridium amylolyticum]
MKAVVIYKSKTGFTKKYAEWIAEELHGDIFDVSKADINMLEDYDTIVYGGSLYASGILGVKFILKNLDKLKDKKIAVFATGASPSREEPINEVRDRNFTKEQQEQLAFFYLRGGFDYTKLNVFDKFLMSLLKWQLKKKKELTLDDRGMLAAYENPIDFTRKKNIEELIAWIARENK